MFIIVAIVIVHLAFMTGVHFAPYSTNRQRETHIRRRHHASNAFHVLFGQPTYTHIHSHRGNGYRCPSNAFATILFCWRLAIIISLNAAFLKCFIVACYAILHSALSVHHSVRLSVTPSFFWILQFLASGLLPK